MKKILISMVFVSAIILMSSCTADSLEETKSVTNMNTKKIITTGVVDSIAVKNAVMLNGDNDKDRVKL
jgi:hypothetical protein